jgi:hypothetical protein
MYERQSRIQRILDAISQLFNVIIFDGDANASISGDSYKYNIEWRMKVIDFIFSFRDKDHCKSAYEKDVMLAYMLIEEHESRKD